MTILETRNLEKNYSSFSLKNIDLKIQGGEIVALVGENGAGKSTTIATISGLRKKSGGEILFYGKDVDSLNEEEREKMAFAYDETSFPLDFTISAIGNYGKMLYYSWSEEKWKDLTKRLSLPTGKKLGDFSKGMKAKTEIAYCLSHNPSLLVLDETTSSLDPVVRDELMELFQEYVEDGEKSILFSSHITSDLEKIADRIIFIHKGRIVLSSDRNELDEKWVIAKVGKDTAITDDKSIVARRQKEYSLELLVSDRKEFSLRHPEASVEKASIEDILLMISRGEEER
ncbi:MAG: ABC transporter ATP-binding protein [Candidatus Ornithospirochaeta sp.]